MSITVFWSWQSDRPNTLNKEFVKEALDLALHKVAAELVLTPAERPEVDHDTKGEAGLVEIVATIFKKIAASAVFVADVTPVAKTDGGKKVPNPNVMIELGHALSTLGHEKIIAVTNLAFGGGPADLPFDLRHRRGAIGYTLKKGAEPSIRATVLEGLASDLAGALALNLGTVLADKDKQLKFERIVTLSKDPSTWLAPGELIQHRDWFGGAAEFSLRPLGQVRSYVRAVPASWNGDKPSRGAVHGAPQGSDLFPLGQNTSADGGVNTLGAVRVAISGDRTEETQAATQWFNATGEIWAFDARIVHEGDGQQLLLDKRVLAGWAALLDRIALFYTHFDANLPWQIEVGIVNMHGVRWAHSSASARASALDSAVSLQEVSRNWNEEARPAYLLRAYTRLCLAYEQPAVTAATLKKMITAINGV